jgi:hypothetical protein
MIQQFLINNLFACGCRTVLELQISANQKYRHQNKNFLQSVTNIFVQTTRFDKKIMIADKT